MPKKSQINEYSDNTDLSPNPALRSERECINNTQDVQIKNARILLYRSSKIDYNLQYPGNWIV